MSDWEDVQAKKSEMQNKALAALSTSDYEILLKVLEMEWEKRDLKTPDIRKPLRTFIQQVIK